MPHYPSEAYTPAGEQAPLSEYAGRRERLMDLIGDGVAVIAGATEPMASVQFWQNNDFFYFTGVEVPGAFLVIDGVTRESALFYHLSEDEAKDRGIPLGLVHDPAAATGMEQIGTVEEFEPYLSRLAARTPRLFTPHFPQELSRVTSATEEHAAWKRTVTDNPWDGRQNRQQRFVQRLQEKYPQAEVLDCSRMIWDLRKIKSKAEVALIRKAAQIAVDAHLAVIRSTQPGVQEQELAALFEFICGKGGAQAQAYVTIIMSGTNHPYGHYHRHDRTLESGDFVILDAGPDYSYYDADVSTSFPVNGVFTDHQRELYEIAEEIHQVCLAGYQPGRTLREVGADVAAFLTAKGLDPADKRFRYAASWGGYNHPIGMATHDVMRSITGPDEPLEPGFVFACDINIPLDEDFGIRIEDTVVITEDGCEVLSAGLPRTIAEIESLMKEKGLLQRMDGK
ncbi:MAG: aminopeptidase P family protein [Planctomycetes bacterium]|nr:aminopeptidase P family protein [Planctomycetota bacterium]MCP4861049.1 aminopeptidase P family protein [Planctomycetota bacterium]